MTGLKIWKIVIVLFMLMTTVKVAMAVQLAFDGFESGSFCGGSGWSDACWTTEGNTAIRGWTDPYEGNRHVFLRSNDGVLLRSIDITGMSEIDVSFALKVVSFETTDRADLAVSIDGGEFVILKEWSPEDNNGIWHLQSYDVVGTGNSMVVRFRSLMSDLGDEIHFDNIEVNGIEGVNSEVSITMDDNYPVGSDAVISVASTEASVLHTLKVSDGTEVFCEENVLSPSVPNTMMDIVCTMPNESITDAKAEFFVTNDISINATRYFNVVALSSGEQLKITQVYYSPQVLQGGSTEIFAIIENQEIINKIQTKLIYPNGNTRLLSMASTGNLGEYRAFITDTYHTGNVSFEIAVQSDNYIDTYTNFYTVVPYNVDFVDLVNLVSEVLHVRTVERILSATMDVHGTEYVPLDNGRVFIQLLDGYNKPIEEKDCYVSIYYPNNQNFRYQQKMSYADEGLYFYDFVVPYPNGNYMVSSYCIVDGINLSYIYVTDPLDNSVSGGSGWDGNWALNGATFSTDSYEGTHSLLLDSNGDAPSRDIQGNENYTSATVRFYYKASSFEGSDSARVYLKDASGNDYLLLLVEDGDDDNVWKYFSHTIHADEDAFDFDGILDFNLLSYYSSPPGDDFWIDDIDIEFSEEIVVNETEYQVVRGSGEVHVSSDFLYSYKMVKGELYENFSHYYEVKSQTFVNTSNVEVVVHLHKPFPCNHVLGVFLQSGSEWQNLSDIRYEQGDDGRCQVKFDLDLDFQEDYTVRIDSQNYWKKTLMSDYRDIVLLHDLIEIACVNYQLANGFSNYTVPVVNVPMTNDSFYDSCYGFFDSYHNYGVHLDAFLPLLDAEVNFTYDEMSYLEVGFLHVQDVGREIRRYGMTITDGLNLGNSYSIALISDLYPPNNPPWAVYFANISSSFISYGMDRQDFVELSAILNDLNVSSSITPELIWSHTNRTLSASAQSFIGGTEYSASETEGRVVVRMTDSSGSPVTGASCLLTVYYNNSILINQTNMMEYIGSPQGVYSANFSLSGIEGVYPYAVDCTKGGKKYYLAGSYHIFGNEEVLGYLQGINTTVSDIYGLLVLVDGIIDDMNDVLLNFNETTTEHLIAIRNDLEYLREEVIHTNDFNSELIFLITDSIIATQKAIASDDDTVKTESLELAKERLQEYRKGIDGGGKDSWWRYLLYIGVGIGVSVVAVALILRKKESDDEIFNRLQANEVEKK